MKDILLKSIFVFGVINLVLCSAILLGLSASLGQAFFHLTKKQELIIVLVVALWMFLPLALLAAVEMRKQKAKNTAK
ncbi:hypothetical protein HYT26_00980 [Candidatus Pacearchaeota archaeon]|nr:hypothetical protein [Candidatus Pacearchaeota archaeon]